MYVEINIIVIGGSHMELRKCKECGKMFMPKGREQYCSDVHYRPCPVCGTPVLAKYLSDPPRRCDKCKGKKSEAAAISVPASKPAVTAKQPKSIFNLGWGKLDKPTAKPTVAGTTIEKPEKAVEPIVEGGEEIQVKIDPTMFCNMLTGATCRYRGHETTLTNKFIPGHIYRLVVEKNEWGYTVSSTEDVTLGETVPLRRHRYASQLSIGYDFVSQAIAE